MAMGMLQRAQNAGKTVTPGNVAHYTLLHLRSGRRTTGYSSADPLHPATQSAGRARVHSLEEPIARTAADDAGAEPLTLGEALATREDDPANRAARQLDWDKLLQALDDIFKEILIALGSGSKLTLLVSRLGRSRSKLQYDTERLASIIREQLGDDILRQVQEQPTWHSNILADREWILCRLEQRTF